MSSVPDATTSRFRNDQSKARQLAYYFSDLAKQTFQLCNMFFTALAASAAVANENLGFLIVICGLLLLFAPICPTSDA